MFCWDTSNKDRILSVFIAGHLLRIFRQLIALAHSAGPNISQYIGSPRETQIQMFWLHSAAITSHVITVHCKTLHCREKGKGLKSTKNLHNMN